MFLDDARAVADWDAQLDPVVPLERRDRQEVDAVRHEPAGVLRELQRRHCSDAGVLRVQELSEEHSLVIFGSIT